MRQNAVVLSKNGDIAKIKVLRSTMCEGCAQSRDAAPCACGQLFGANRVAVADACNAVGANVGDRVEIETASSVVLTYAALVFLMPLLVFFLLYSILDACTDYAALPWIVGGSGFLLSFVPIALFERIRRSRKPDLQIVNIIFSESSDPVGSGEETEQ